MRAGIFFLSGLIYFFSFEDGIGLPAMFCMFGVVGINILLGTQSIRFPWLPLQPPATNVINYDHHRAIKHHHQHRHATPTLSD